MLTILEAKEKGLIPKYLWDEIIENCDVNNGGCGGPIYTTSNLKKQWCDNPRCRLKLAAMAVKSFNNFGELGVGPEFFKSFFQVNSKFKSHLAIFVATEEELLRTGERARALRFIKCRERILNERYTFSTVVSKLSLPNLGSTALTIFDLFENYKIFLKYLEVKELSITEYISGFRGLGVVSGENINETLVEFEEDLKIINQIFKIKPYAKTKFTVAITGAPGFHMMTKGEYLKHLNRVGDDLCSIEFTQTALRSCDYIVCSSANEHITDMEGNKIKDEDGEFIITPGTIKKNIGIERNKEEGRKVLITAQELKEIVVDNVRRLR